MSKTLKTTAVIFLLLTCQAGATTWHVPADVPTIQGAIDLAESGDDVLVAPGEYFEHDITLKGGVTVHTEQGPEATVVDAEGLGRGFFGSNLGELATLEGFTIRNGLTTGYAGGAGAWQSPFTIRDCIVENCSAAIGGGIYARGVASIVAKCTVRDCTSDLEGGGVSLHVFGTAEISGCNVIDNFSRGEAGGISAGGYDGTVTIRDCIVSGNRANDGVGGGISCLGSYLVVRNCLVTHNSTYGWWGGGGIIASASSGYGLIEGCTISHNVGHVADGLDVRGSIEVRNTISCFNQGRGMRCEGYSSISVGCCDVYGNGEGNDLCGADLGGNFSSDPLFCNPEAENYTLDENSPCLPGNHPHGDDCGLIGARDFGCGAVPVEHMTWGRLKAGFR